MARPMSVSDSVVIGADTQTVYANVSDPTRTGRWSPENLGATTDRPGAALAVGDTFVGRNKRGVYRWSTRCRVTAADPEQRFAFTVEAIGLRTPRLTVPIATWTYELARVPAGTRVTETWTDDRTAWSDRRAKFFDKLATRSTFAEFNARNIRTSLANLKRTLEK